MDWEVFLLFDSVYWLFAVTGRQEDMMLVEERPVYRRKIKKGCFLKIFYHFQPHESIRLISFGLFFYLYFSFVAYCGWFIQELGRRLIAVYSRDKPFSNCAVNNFPIFEHINICFSSEMQVSHRSWSIIFLPTSIFGRERMMSPPK